MELIGGGISDDVISPLGVMTDGTGYGRAKRWHTRAHDRAENLMPASTTTEHFCAADSFAVAEEWDLVALFRAL